MLQALRAVPVEIRDKTFFALPETALLHCGEQGIEIGIDRIDFSARKHAGDDQPAIAGQHFGNRRIIGISRKAHQFARRNFRNAHAVFLFAGRHTASTSDAAYIVRIIKG